MLTPLTLQMLRLGGRKTEAKQSLVQQAAGRAVTSILLPQTHYLQSSINPSIPKNTSSGFLQHCLTAACLRILKPHEPPLPPHHLPPLSPLFSSFPFSSFSHILLFPISFSTSVLVRMARYPSSTKYPSGKEDLVKGIHPMVFSQARCRNGKISPFPTYTSLNVPLGHNVN